MLSEHDGTAAATKNSSTQQQRYRGLIKRSIFKDMRDHLFAFFDYMYTLGTVHPSPVMLGRWLVDFQIALACFVQFDQRIWPKDTVLGRTMTVLSAMSALCPTNVSPWEFVLVNYIFMAVVVVILLALVVSCVWYVRNLKVNSYLVDFISTVLASLSPWIMNVFTVSLARCIYHIAKKEISVAAIVAMLFNAVCIFVVMYLYVFFVTNALSYRPQVFHIMSCKWSLIHLLSMISVLFLTTIGGLFQSNVPLYLNCVPGVLVFVLTYRQYIWGDIEELISTQSLAFICMLLSFVLPTLVILDTGKYDILVVVFAASYFLFAMIFEKVNTRIINNTLEAIYEFEQAADESAIEKIPYKKLMNMLRIGFENGSAICHTWKLFNMAMEVYPNDTDIIICHARYAAIYPGETWPLHQASRRLKDVKHGNIAVKNLLFQVNALIQHRQRLLSDPLERSLNRIKRKIARCRNQIKYTWECIMRDNVSELEGLAAQVKATEDEIMREYDQLTVVYPSSPHVAVAYATFLDDIVRDEDKAHELRRASQSLRNGTRTKFERTYYYAVNHILSLPSEEDHFRISNRDRAPIPDSSSVADATVQTETCSTDDSERELTSQQLYVDSTVRTVKLPTMRYGPLVIAFMLCLAIPIASIPILILVTGQMEKAKESLHTSSVGALLHVSVAQLIYCAFQYVFSSHKFIPTLKQRFDNIYDTSLPQYADKKPNYYVEDDRLAMIDWIRTVADYHNLLQEFLGGIIVNSHYDTPRRVMYGGGSVLQRWKNATTAETWVVSLQHALSYITSISIQIANCDLPDMFDYPGIWTLLRNGETVMRNGEEFLDSLVLATSACLTDRANRYLFIILVVFITLVVIGALAIGFMSARLEKETALIYNSFRALPKSAISTIIQQLSSQSGKEVSTDDITGNDPKENALRVLSSKSQDRFGWVAKTGKILVLTVAYLIALFVIVYQQASVLKSRTAVVTKIVPLYTDLLRMHVKYMVSLVLLQRTALSGVAGFNQTYPDDYKVCVNQTYTLMREAMVDAHNLRFGNKELNSGGISMMGPGLVERLSEATRDADITKLPKEDIEILDRSSYDTATQFINRMFSRMVANIERGDNGSPKYDYYPINAEEFDLAGVWLLGTSYYGYVLDSLNLMNQAVEDLMSTYINSYLIIPYICLLLFIVIIGVLIVPTFVKNREIAEWIPQLLLFCDPSVVLQTKPVLKILSNDFTASEIDEIDERASFYEVIAANLPFGVLLLSNTLEIHSVNAAVEQITGKPANDLIGTDLRNLFEAAPGSENKLRSFYQALDGALGKLRSPQIESDIVIKRDNTTLSLNVSINSLSIIGEIQTDPTNREGMVILVMIIRDMTSIVQARDTLATENKRNEDLMSMLFPVPIVKRILKGERDISFGAPTVTMAFIDIVKFTAWCEKHEPSFILGVLNRLYRHMDDGLQLYPKVTKLRVMSDTYVCVGGVFDEVSQPEEHAKQVLSFCIDSMEIMRAFNRELGESLSIRIGCNTGGPVMAGILGTARPCFDVIGPVVSVAALMEETGVPDNVHIPDSVYQVIFDQGFVIKAHNDIPNGDKILHTYLVSGYTQAVS